MPGDDPRFALNLQQISLDMRTGNTLEARGYDTVGKLLAANPQDLLLIPNFGEKTLASLMRCLSRLGFRVPAKYLGRLDN